MARRKCERNLAVPAKRADRITLSHLPIFKMAKAGNEIKFICLYHSVTVHGTCFELFSPRQMHILTE